MRDAELPRRAHDSGRRHLAEVFERPHRREYQRQPQPPPELEHRGVDPAHVPQHPRAKCDLVEGEAVASQGGFGLGGADDVVPVVLVEVLARLGDDLMQGLEIEAGGGEAPRGASSEF